MTERRNYYRILGVQPDAAADVIRGAYRTLMQKLQMHPDLGGCERDAVAINAAWQVLRDPLRRAQYDQELLREHDIRVLASAGDPQATATGPHTGNRRNYYRILGVQPDAPAALIHSAYRVKSATDGLEAELIAEAYGVLADENRREQYDLFLAGGADADMEDEYTPVISTYCLFCKTPHNAYPGVYRRRHCGECDSPLHHAGDFSSRSGRRFRRLNLDEPVMLYEYWPGSGLPGRVEEITPDGLCMMTQQALEPDQIVRITARTFDAVAKVVHCSASGDKYRTGMELLAAMFDSAGIFVDQKA